MPQVIIRRDKDGREYEIDSADFRRGKYYRNPDGEMLTYAEAGFKIVSLADGSEYTPPTPRGEHAP